MKKYKVKTLLLSALIAGMVGAFCLSGCGKSSAAPIPVTQEQSQTEEAKPVKIAKLSMDRAAVSLLSESAGEQKTVSKKIQAIIEPSTAKNASVDWSVEWGNAGFGRLAFGNGNVQTAVHGRNRSGMRNPSRQICGYLHSNLCGAAYRDNAYGEYTGNGRRVPVRHRKYIRIRD